MVAVNDSSAALGATQAADITCRRVAVTKNEHPRVTRRTRCDMVGTVHWAGPTAQSGTKEYRATT
jgi:hypothetical protein